MLFKVILRPFNTDKQMRCLVRGPNRIAVLDAMLANWPGYDVTVERKG